MVTAWGPVCGAAGWKPAGERRVRRDRDTAGARPLKLPPNAALNQGPAAGCAEGEEAHNSRSPRCKPLHSVAAGRAPAPFVIGRSSVQLRPLAPVISALQDSVLRRALFVYNASFRV